MFGVIFPKLNEWVDVEADGFPHIWIGRAFEWIDTCVQSGKKVEPTILFGLMFGQYIEERTAQLRAAGANDLDALTQAVAETLSDQAQRVMIPRKVGLPMRDMYWNQQRFDRREGRHPRYFLHRPGFRDAWEYCRFKSEVTGERMDLRVWWREFIKANPAPPVDAHAPKERKPPARSARPSRRRRRGGKKSSGENRPKI